MSNLLNEAKPSNQILPQEKCVKSNNFNPNFPIFLHGYIRHIRDISQLIENEKFHMEGIQPVIVFDLPASIICSWPPGLNIVTWVLGTVRVHIRMLGPVWVCAWIDFSWDCSYQKNTKYLLHHASKDFKVFWIPCKE